MFDARTFPKTLDDTKRILLEKEAVFKGEYKIHDIIFSSKNPKETLDKVFLRLRLIPVNIWDEKGIIVAIKNTELKEVGKQSKILIKEQFDTEADARKFIEENYSDRFQYFFEFDRTGWQYFIGEDGIDLEDIEGHFSIEFKSKTEEGLRKLLSAFNIQAEEVLKDPSIIIIRDLLGR